MARDDREDCQSSSLVHCRLSAVVNGAHHQVAHLLRWHGRAVGGCGQVGQGASEAAGCFAGWRPSL